jgi:hypothetical protein
VRLVTATETEEGRRWAESRIKQLTGGDTVAARFMRQDFFEYRPAFKLVIAGNHKPSLRSVDEAIRRRFHLIPFAVTVPEAERDPDLAEKLKEEWPGVLAWLIKGCLEWQAEGLQPPQAVRAATEAYLSAEDSLSALARGGMRTRGGRMGAVNRAVRIVDQLGERRRRTSRQQQTVCASARDQGGFCRVAPDSGARTGMARSVKVMRVPSVPGVWINGLRAGARAHKGITKVGGTRGTLSPLGGASAGSAVDDFLIFNPLIRIEFLAVFQVDWSNRLSGCFSKKDSPSPPVAAAGGLRSAHSAFQANFRGPSAAGSTDHCQ